MPGLKDTHMIKTIALIGERMARLEAQIALLQGR